MKPSFVLRISSFGFRISLERCLPSYTREFARGAKNLLSCGFCDEFIGVGVAASQESLNLNAGVGADFVAMRAWYFFEQSVAAQQPQKASHPGRTATAFEW